jgi:DNA processing protein
MQNLSDYRSLLGLTLVPNIGAQRIKLLLQHFEDADTVLAASLKQLQKVDGIGYRLAREISKFDNWDEVDDILELTEKSEAWLLDLTDTNYPGLLKHIYDPPILMWGLGDPLVLNEPMLAVVGTRRMTSYGKTMARKISEDLVQQDVVIVSGLALGVDTTAHETTIENGGRTVAVLGSGIDWIYPRGNRKLAQEIIRTGGAILTEFPPKTKPDAGNFPPRNRIVSGMSHGTIVIESGLKGGSMITARVALDQNREVFAIPHQVTAPNGVGCNSLIQRGWAKLILSADDVMVEFPDLQQYEPDAGPTEESETIEDARWKSQIETLSQQEVHICELLNANEGALHIDHIADKLNKPIHELTSLLLQLEMRDLVEQQAGKRFTIL